MKIEADNLQEAFQRAAKELSCSVTELEIEVIQHPSNGLLGFFKKNAIIEAHKEGSAPKQKTKRKNEKPKSSSQSKDHVKEKVQKETSKQEHKSKSNKKEERLQAPREKKPLVEMSIAVPQIIEGVKKLLQSSCFDMEHVAVRAYSDDTVLIELNGQDAALLIGKEGYRYKAFSYLLYNWINIKYGLGIRLEIAEFLKNQEEMIEKYLVPVIERIENNGRGQTKPLDGVLIKIALERLRARFPDKYVGIKTGREGVKFIVVNSFNKK